MMDKGSGDHGRTNSMHLMARADAVRIPLADRSVDLVFGSPPYCDARTYGIGAQRDCLAWVQWMLQVTTESQRISRGPVVWVAAGVTRDRNYWPACEGLMWEWWKKGGECHLYRPCYWHRVGIPGSGHDDWFRFDVEYVMCFKRPGKLAWSDNTAMGTPPVYGAGGPMSNRLKDGLRKNDPWNKQGRGNGLGGRRIDGQKNVGSTADRRAEIRESEEVDHLPCSVPVLANPGTLISTGSGGGGSLGSKIAHENEAPFPEALPEHFIRSLCPEGGIVVDPFSGSGTTASVARRWGRRAFGFDLRESQCRLGRKRVASQATMLDGLAG